MQSIEFPSDTDGALSPPVRSNYNKSTSDSLKRKFSVLESRATHAGPAKRQQTLTTFHQATKSGSHQNHTSSRDLLDARLQKARVANTVHGGAKPAGGTSALNGYQLELQKQIEAKRKAAAAAQERQRAAARKERDDAQRLASDRAKVAAATGRRLEDHRAEQDAWLDRASVTAHNSTSRPGGLSTFPSAAADRERFDTVRQRLETHRAEQDTFIDRAAAARTSTSRPAGLPSHSHAPARPRPTAATRPYPRPKKQPPSILGQISTDAKRAKERQARELKARKEHGRAASDDTTDSEAQQEAEANHAISKPPPYQPLRPLNAVTGAHALSRPRLHDPPLRTTNPIPEANDNAAPQIDPNDDELVLEPSPPPQGPFSLNSAAGIRALQKSHPRPPLINLPFDDDGPTTTTTQRWMATGTPKTKLTLKKPSRNQDILPITASDLKLYQWREQNFKWAEVRQLYSDFTGIFPLISEDTLRTRFRQVSKVVEIGVVTDEMCERVINGDEAAATELNRLAGQYIDSSATATPAAGLEAAPFKKIVKQTPAPRGATVPPPPAAAAAVAASRPTQGGKMLDHDSYLVLLGHAVDAGATENDFDDSSRESSPRSERDRIHFEYYMQHRYYHSEDIDNDFGDQEDSETPWVEHNSSFAHAGFANAEAVQYVMTVPEGVPAIFKPAEEWQLTHTPLKEGMSQFSIKTAHGLVQTKVDRRLWTWQDHVMPDTKEGWVPKTLYGVFVKKTERRTRIVRQKKTTEKAAAAVVVVETDKDSLFGDEEEAEKADDQDEEEEVEESYIDFDFYQVDHAVYGDVNQANQEAIKEWVRLTMKPSSRNYDEHACRCAEARQELQRRLEEAPEGTAFSEVWEDDEKTVEVFAKALTMKGARN